LSISRIAVSRMTKSGEREMPHPKSVKSIKIKHPKGIDSHAADADFKMQMRAGGNPGVSRKSHRLPLINAVALRNEHLA